MQKSILVWLMLCAAVNAWADEASDPAAEGEYLARIRPLTIGGERSGEGYFSPDGKRFIFQSEREADNPFYQIYIMDLGNGDIHRVSSGVGKTTCAYFRPGSDQVLFASTHLDPQAVDKQRAEIDFRNSGKSRRYSWDYDENYDIFMARRDGREIKRITNTLGYDAEGSYSPDGKRIVFCSTRDAYPLDKLSGEDRSRMEVDVAYFGEIYVMNADGSDATRLTQWPGYDGGPFFSPDGRSIIWRHFDESGALADIYVMSADGGGRRQLTDFQSMCWAPYYHPSGEYVIFTSNKLGFANFELYLVDARGNHMPVRITHTDGFDGLPVFSPDGSALAWTTNRGSSGKSQIYIADWNHEAALAALAQSPPRGAGHSYDPAISGDDIRTDVGYLASDALEGRMTASNGARLAAAYIEDRFKELGIEPGSGEGYVQTFPFTSGVSVVESDNHMTVDAGGEKTECKVNEAFRPLGFSSDGEIAGEVVFAGYGLTVAGDEAETYDSFDGLDVADKIVLVLRYAPEEVEMDRRDQLNMYSGLRYKAMLARDHGAKGLLIVAGPNSPNAGELVPLRNDQSHSGSGIVAASITREVADRIFAAAGKDLKEVQSQLDIENPHFEGHFAVPEVTVRLAVSLNHESRTGQNVIGLIPPTASTEPTEYIVIGAHYDHIGYGEIGSLARKGEEGQIHNGADDNASGTATVLELAAALVDAKQRDPQSFARGVVIALWSGEELGIIGSNYFATQPTVPIESIVAYLNFDMVGRLRDNKLMLQGVASSSAWTGLIERRNVAAGFNVVLQDDPYLPTDVTAFYPKKIPVLSFFTGSHEDYNRPTDDAETLDYEGMERIAALALDIIRDLVADGERPDYVVVERSKKETGDRAALRAYLGTIPDYATEGIEGVKLSGVRAGGPADKAGLTGGDIIVEFAGRQIANIYDYTYALDAVKIGQAVAVVVLRGDQRVTLSVVPEARK